MHVVWETGGLETEFTRLQMYRPISREAQAVFGWSTWKTCETSLTLWDGETPVLLLSLERDAFNSEMLQVPQMRLHWLANPVLSWSGAMIAELAETIRSLLLVSDARMVALRVFGHPLPMLNVFQQAGFHLIGGTGWYYLRPNQPVEYEIPEGVRVEYFALDQSPLPAPLLERLLEVAEVSTYPDRFFLDPRLDPQLVRRRFVKVAENALRGQLATTAIVGYVDNDPRAVMYFHQLPPTVGRDYTLVDSWHTTLVHPSVRRKRVGWVMLLDSVRHIGDGNTYWLYTCALDNFASIEGVRKAGALLGTTAYDLHWWRP